MEVACKAGGERGRRSTDVGRALRQLPTTSYAATVATSCYGSSKGYWDWLYAMLLNCKHVTTVILFVANRKSLRIGIPEWLVSSLFNFSLVLKMCNLSVVFINSFLKQYFLYTLAFVCDSFCKTYVCLYLVWFVYYSRIKPIFFKLTKF